MATIKDKIGLAMLPSAQSGGASASTTDFSGTVHSLLPIQHESPNLIIPDLVSGWTLSNGSVSNGVYTASLTAYQSGIKVTPPFIDSYTIKVTFDLVVNSGSIRVDDGLSGVVNTFSTSGSKEITFNGFNKIEFNAYNLGFDGTISNVKLTRITNGDFQFERSSSATRVGSDGYIKNVEVLSDELVQNGDFEDVNETEEVVNGTFDTDTVWTKQEGWAIANGVATFDYTTIAVSSNRNLYQNPLTTGKVYKLTFDITSYTSGFIRNVNSSITDDESFSGVGSYTQYFRAASVNLYLKASNDAILSIDNVSVKEVGQNWNFNEWTVHDDNGNLKAKFIGSTSGQYLQQQNVYTAGDKIRLKFTLSNFTSGSLRAISTGVVWNTPTISATNGTYTYDIDTTGASNGHIYFQAVGGNFNGSIDNISVVEITDDTDIPRLDFSNAAQPSLLLEPQRTNEITYSEQPIQGFGLNDAQNITITQNATTSPDGSKNAMLVESTNTNSKLTVNSVDFVSGTTYTASCYVKNIDATSFNMFFYNASGTPSSTQIDKSSELDTEWTRIYATYTATANDTGNSSQVQFARGLPSGESLYMWGFQIEEGSYPTSYIPTNGSTVTRLADVCNNAGDSTIFNDAEGVLFADISSLNGDSSSNREISLSDGTTGNSVRIYYAINYENRINPRVDVGGSTVWVGSVDVTTKHIKVALRYSSAGMDFYVNGVKEVTTTTVPNFTNSLRSLQIRRGDGNTGSDFYGNVRQLLYFDEALTDAELERLTSSDITQVLRNYNRRGELLGATYESTHVQTKLNELF